MNVDVKWGENVIKNVAFVSCKIRVYVDRDHGKAIDLKVVKWRHDAGMCETNLCDCRVWRGAMLLHWWTGALCDWIDSLVFLISSLNRIFLCDRWWKTLDELNDVVVELVFDDRAMWPKRFSFKRKFLRGCYDNSRKNAWWWYNVREYSIEATLEPPFSDVLEPIVLLS